jgi:hypothetical protein
MTAGPARVVFAGTGTAGPWGDVLRAAESVPGVEPGTDRAARAQRNGREPPRLRSAAVFGNRFFAEVVTAVDRLPGAEDAGVTVRMVAADTGLADSVVRPVMRRLADGGLLAEPAREGSARSPLHYQVLRTPLWLCVLSVCTALA